MNKKIEHISKVKEILNHRVGTENYVSILSQLIFLSVQNDYYKKSVVPVCLNALLPKKKLAFTMSEVLITLGIIGVVAA